ncbi:hypothetical protein J6590_060753 [Homalodisca vitripennis]|nr:hypothetical protein J6590_060753 [Homalodisca vitripennis]
MLRIPINITARAAAKSAWATSSDTFHNRFCHKGGGWSCESRPKTLTPLPILIAAVLSIRCCLSLSPRTLVR